MEASKLCFSGLLIKRRSFSRGRQYRANSTVEAILTILLNEKMTELREKDEAQFEHPLKVGNVTELCIALGLDENFVRVRCSAISIMRQELELPGKTPTLISIWHLIRRIGFNNPVGDQDHMHGAIRDNFKGSEWLSHLGVRAKRNDAKTALQTIYTRLDEKGYSNR